MSEVTKLPRNINERLSWFDGAVPFNEKMSIFDDGVEAITLSPSKEADIVNYRADHSERIWKGWVLGALVRTNSSSVRFKLKVTSPEGDRELSYTPSELKTLGFTQANTFLPWLARYDDLNTIYVVVYSPSPWLPFNGSLTGSVKNEGTATATVTNAHVVRILMK